MAADQAVNLSDKYTVCTLVQSVKEGHLSQLHLGPQVVQDLPAPLERAEDTLTLKPGFGNHIQPATHSTTHKLVLRGLQPILLLYRELKLNKLEAA